jgi:hypothetical protein
METLFTKVDYTVSLLIQKIEIGEIGLPDIQRPFVWNSTKVRDLFDSMFKGFPVGYLLFWTSSNESGTKQIGEGIKQIVPRLLIVDGQQRLTSLFSIIRNKSVVNENYESKKINIAFRPRDGYFTVADAAVVKDPEYIKDISEIWSSKKSHIRYVNDFIKTLKTHKEITYEEEDIMTTNIDRLYDLHNYPFTALEISSAVDEEDVAEIFVRINSQGVTLNQADFILTLMSVFWDEGRAKLEEFSRNCKIPAAGASPFNYYIEPSPDQMLRVSIGYGFRRARLKYAYSILRGKDLETEKFSEGLRDKQFERLQESQEKVLNLNNWHEYLKALRIAGFMSSKMISSKTGFLYTYVLYLLGKYDYGLEHHRLRKLIARWFFMQQITRRYTGSPETIMEGDLARFRQIETAEEFEIIVNRIIEDNLTEDFWSITLVNELEVSSATTPSIFAYYAALCLLDAKVLFSTMTVREMLEPSTRSSKASVERHHLFPRNYLKSIGYESIKETNQIANFALVEWADNIQISDKAPKEYIGKYLERMTEEEKNRQYYIHALPEKWEEMEYKEFLEIRRKKIAQVVRDGFERLK